MTDLFFGTSGPHSAQIMLLGEAWGETEDELKRPFVGGSGQEYDRILGDAGILRDDCFATNVAAARPPGNDMEYFFRTKKDGVPPLRGLYPSPFIRGELDRLYKQIEAVNPKVIVASGNWALWALTNCANPTNTKNKKYPAVKVPAGITSWRGSMIHDDAYSHGFKVLPIIHPAAILRAWYQRAITVHDLKTRVPQALANDWSAEPFTVLAPPTFEEALHHLLRWCDQLKAGIELRLANDIETYRGLMTCMGFADSTSFAMSIPWVRKTDHGLESYWTPVQESTLVRLIIFILTHPLCRIEGQNYIYDTQYIWRFWRIIPRLDFDTMLAHHLCFPGTPQGLDYLSSLHCKYHRYWKDDGKEWDTKGTLEQLLLYNAEDCLRTFEVATSERSMIVQMGLEEQWEWEKKKHQLALEMMMRGTLIDRNRRAQMGFELLAARNSYDSWFESVVPAASVPHNGTKPWWRSPIQQQTLFYDQLGLPIQRDKKTKQPTADSEAIIALRPKAPHLVRLFDALEEYRSVNVFYSTFVAAPLDHDNRMRCSFKPAGTETFRWSSSKNAFGSGTNLQNIPKGEEE